MRQGGMRYKTMQDVTAGTKKLIKALSGALYRPACLPYVYYLNWPATTPNDPKEKTRYFFLLKKPCYGIRTYSGYVF